MSLQILEMDRNLCTGCGACVSTCPKSALTLQYDKEGFYIPVLNETSCVECGACGNVCHALNHKQPKTPKRNYKSFMVKSHDASLVAQSSSGGAFSLLAAQVIKEGGVVWGARYNYEKDRLEHCSTDECTIEELRKSKYIESYMGDTFAKVRQQLLINRRVLFVGTPCQVEGLRTYLLLRKVDTANLLLVRFVCHGVPSNRFFTEYKHYEEEKRGSKMVHFDFRPKTRGWRNSDWYMKFADGNEEYNPYFYYYYYYYFQKNNLLRNCCYNCHRVFHDIADITIADFWGIGKFRPGNRDQEGISAVLAHTNKGLNAVSLLDGLCDMEDIPPSSLDYIYEEATSKQQDLERRTRTMSKVLEHGYMTVAKKELMLPMFIMKLKYNIKKVLHG